MGRRLDRGIRAAIKAAKQSEFYAHRVGAVIFKGSALISTGFNKHKTHPECLCFTQHAEFNALLRCKQRDDLHNLTMYVARLTRTDYISYSRPCSNCQIVIAEAGLKRVYYSDYNGKPELLIPDNTLEIASGC